MCCAIRLPRRSRWTGSPTERSRMTILPADQMAVNFVAHIGGAAGRVIILERLQQPEAGDIAALVVLLEQQVHQHVGVGVNPVGAGGGDELVLDLARQLEPLERLRGGQAVGRVHGRIHLVADAGVGLEGDLKIRRQFITGARQHGSDTRRSCAGNWPIWR